MGRGAGLAASSTGAGATATATGTTTAATTGASVAAAEGATVAGASVAAGATAGAGTAAAGGAVAAGVTTGPVGWIALAVAATVALLKSKKISRILLWIGIILIVLAILTFVIVAGLFQQKKHFGADVRGGVERTDIVNQSLPAQASNDKGQAVVTGLDLVDKSIAGAEKTLASNPNFPNTSRIKELLNNLKNLRRDTETKSYGASIDQSKQLKHYRQILADLALALDSDAAAKRDSLQTLIESSSGITIADAHTCAPARDISNLAVSGKLLGAMIKIAELAKANNTTASLTCLVTGYRDLTDGAYRGYPMCTNQDMSNPALTERQHNIGVHCNGRGADFGGDWESLSALIKANASQLGIETVLESQDHLHIEVLP